MLQNQPLFWSQKSEGGGGHYNYDASASPSESGEDPLSPVPHITIDILLIYALGGSDMSDFILDLYSKNCGVKITPPVLIEDHTMHFTPC